MFTEQEILDNYIRYYEAATDKQKKKIIFIVESQLEKAKVGESIGFPLEPKKVAAGKRFIQYVNEKNS